MAGKNNKAGRGSGGSVSPKSYKLAGGNIALKPNELISGPSISNTVFKRKGGRRPLTFGTTLSGQRTTVFGIAANNAAYRNLSPANRKRNLETAKRLKAKRTT